MKKNILILIYIFGILLGCEINQDNKREKIERNINKNCFLIENHDYNSYCIPYTVIGVIDANKILNLSNSAISIRQEIEKRHIEIQKEIIRYEDRLRKRKKIILEQTPNIDEHLLKRNHIEFKKNVSNIQLQINTRKTQVEKGFENARAKIYEHFLISTNYICNNIGVNIVLYKEQIIMTNKRIDITEKVLSRLNKVLPTLKVVYPKIEKIIKNENFKCK